MCGRTACTLAPDEIRRACGYRNRTGQRRRPQWKDGDADKYRPSYNKSPQSSSPVLLSSRHFNKEAPVDECVLATMRWGLVPAWFRESDPNKMQYSTSNCRSESLLEKKSYKDPLLKGQRCVILADGFYEWKRQEKGKQPFFIYFPQSQGAPGLTQQDKQETEESKMLSQQTEGQREGEDVEEVSEWKGWRLLTMAGLFDCWAPPGGGELLYTYTVITVNASPNLQSIHDRMPAILDGEEEVRQWLDFGEVRSLQALKLLQSKSCLVCHPVSSFVNNARNNSPECLQPIDPTAKKVPQTTASSKMMMSWLKTGSPNKRKEPDTDAEAKGSEGKTPEKQKSKPVGPLQQWLLGNSPSKKPRT
ncbi:abasic site processing protein HMCES [Pygocentrus nattereri]|uniref:Abasic site processing protein HMCES n=1 Tax=Pygocentrus nattereri TaxID=42514 RepID=A0A3B4CFR8_PYGNA|nr:abasic site processing protein HMCES [Pygocentrus nattereri]XP_017566817.1 abasic site processing protein HMCES [Pygocentrus nattereri]XP_017566825.1 abasic site processing protein HMCES [Pygocentrus nattereri]XP_037388238.1 abasic site processing protein HMCES [Pygocentrus nattereri]